MTGITWNGLRVVRSSRCSQPVANSVPHTQPLANPEATHDQNRQNTPIVTFACDIAPLPVNVRWPLSGGPVSDEAATAVTPVEVTGSVELLLN